MSKVRVVIAKPGLDGHDRGAKVIARALRDAGMEVIYTGLRQTPEQIVARRAAGRRRRHRPVDPVRRAHAHLPARDGAARERRDSTTCWCVVGGIIPDVDIPKLQAMGVRGHLPARQPDAADHRLHHRERPASRRGVLSVQRLLASRAGAVAFYTIAMVLGACAVMPAYVAARRATQPSRTRTSTSTCGGCRGWPMPSGRPAHCGMRTSSRRSDGRWRCRTPFPSKACSPRSSLFARVPPVLDAQRRPARRHGRVRRGHGRASRGT